MADKDDTTTDTSTVDDKTTKTTTETDAELIARLVQEGVDAALKPIKTKLDDAHAKREAAEAKIKEFEKKERDEQLRRLTEEGKHKEVFELQLSEEKAARLAAEQRVTNLTRDLEVRNALAGLPFRNDKASLTAQREIVSELIQDEAGNWVHKSGAKIADFIKAFQASEDNSYLFKVKVSTGGGSSTTKIGSSDSTEKVSIFARSQDEVLKMAREGKLRRS